MRINFYAQGFHTMVINRYPVTGFADGDWLEVDVDGAHVTRKPGADGPALNWVKAQGGRLVISLLPNSPALGDIYKLRDSFDGKRILFPITLMTGTQEIIKAGGCGFGRLPAFQSGGETMRPRQFVFECLEIDMDPSKVEVQKGGLLGGLIPINL